MNTVWELLILGEHMDDYQLVLKRAVEMDRRGTSLQELAASLPIKLIDLMNLKKIRKEMDKAENNGLSSDDLPKIEQR